MAEIINCPSCQRKLQVPETLAGQSVQCPTCGATFVAQLQDSPPPAPAPDAQPRDPEPRSPERPPQRSSQREWEPDDDYDQHGPQGVRRRHRADYEPHRGTLILVLGILSLVLGGLGFIIGPIAWRLGTVDLAAMKAGRMDPEGEGLTNAGRICGIISTCLGVLTVVALFGICLCGLAGAFSGANAPRRF